MNCLCIKRVSLHLMPEKGFFLIRIYLYNATSMTSLKLWILRSLAKLVWPVFAFRLFSEGKRWFIQSRVSYGEAVRRWRFSHRTKISHDLKGFHFKVLSALGNQTKLLYPGDPLKHKKEPVMDKDQHCCLVMTWYDNCLFSWFVMWEHSGGEKDFVMGTEEIKLKLNLIAAKCFCISEFMTITLTITRFPLAGIDDT